MRMLVNERRRVGCQHWEYLGTCMLTKAVLLGSQTTVTY